MNISIRPLLISIFILSASVSLHADKRGDAAAEQSRLDNQWQEQKIQDNKLEEQHYDDRRQEQKMLDRKMEDRRAEQRRLDNARQRLAMGGEIADRGRGGRDRRDSLRDDQDLMDDTIDQRIQERHQNLEQNLYQFQTGNQYQPQVQAQVHSQIHPQQGCTGPGCQAGVAGCSGFNCQDPNALHRMEAAQKHNEEYHQQRKLVVEQWDKDHPRD